MFVLEVGSTASNLMTVTIDLRARRERLGFDDVCLPRFGHTEADLTESDLRQIRDLVPCRR